MNIENITAGMRIRIYKSEKTNELYGCNNQMIKMIGKIHTVKLVINTHPPIVRIGTWDWHPDDLRSCEYKKIILPKVELFDPNELII
ncbi:MAG: hypothetical protein ACTSWK_00240 [Promethearchaeota archaeon]